MLDFLRLSLNNLRRRKLRAWLTMLGIFIGVAAVVALISLGQGMQDYIEKQFEDLGGNTISIGSRTFAVPGSVTNPDLILTEKDVKVIEQVRGVKIVAGFLMKTAPITFRDETQIGYIIGFDDNYVEAFGTESLEKRLLDGRIVKQGEESKVIVGYKLYDDLFDKGVRLRDKVEFEGREFKVVGILEKIGNPYDDNAVLMRKEVMRELLNIPDEESSIIVKVADGFDPEDVAETIKRKLRQSRGEREGEETFSIQTSEQLLDSFKNIFSIVQTVLIGIASISLIVGGIGIMNTMYTSVLERTKEIGTMKAIGARNSQILLLFLVESGLLGLVGGLIGVGIGIGLAKGVEVGAEMALGTKLLQASLSPVIIFGALAFSFIVGSLSGILPAMQAANMRPVDALRYE